MGILNLERDPHAIFEDPLLAYCKKEASPRLSEFIKEQKKDRTNFTSAEVQPAQA